MRGNVGALQTSLDIRMNSYFTIHACLSLTVRLDLAQGKQVADSIENDHHGQRWAQPVINDCGNCKSCFWQTVQGRRCESKAVALVLYHRKGNFTRRILVWDFSWPFFTHLCCSRCVDVLLRACGILLNHAKLWLAHRIRFKIRMRRTQTSSQTSDG